MSIHLARRGALAASRVLAGGGTATIVQSAAGTTGATTPASFSASLPGASTPGNKLMVIVASEATVNTPAGWTLDRSQVNSCGHYHWSKTSAGETSVTITPTSSVGSSWAILEVSGISVPPNQVTSLGSSSGSTANGTGTTSATSGATGGLAVASFGSLVIGGGAQNSTAYTNGFVELADVVTTRGGGNNDVSLAVATLAVAADGAFSCDVTQNFARPTGIIAVYGP